MNFKFLSTNVAFICFVLALGFSTWTDQAHNRVHRAVLAK